MTNRVVRSSAGSALDHRAAAGRKLGALNLLGRPRALWRFLTHRGAPLLPRLLALFALAYVIMPFDLLTDLVPFVGWLDDMGVVAVVLSYVAAKAARYENDKIAATVEPAV